jgi:hypothetical protein
MPAVLIKMLAASEPGRIDLLPACPAAWPSGTIEGVLCRGQIEIRRLHWDGKSIQAVLRSGVRQDILLGAPGAIGNFSIKRGDGKVLGAADPMDRRLSLPAGTDIEIELVLK